MKKCSKCGETKSLEEFHKCPRHKSKRKSYCKPCANEYSRLYRKRMSKETKRKNGLKVKQHAYFARYGIKYSEYVSMCKNRDFKCDICGAKKKLAATKERHKSKDLLVLDHCHESGKIRGILCQTCNQGLGLFKDNIDILTQAHVYLLETDTDKSDDRKEGL